MESGSKKDKWKETIYYTKRALALWWKEYPQIFFSSISYAVLNAMFPYVGIWFSARIINELAGGRNEKRLIEYVFILLIVTVMLSFLKAAAERWKQAVVEGKYFREKRIYTDKIFEMDFISVDDTRTKELRSKIDQARNWYERGLGMTTYAVENTFEAVFRILGAAALTFSLFTETVKDPSLTFLNTPLFAAVLAVVMFLVIFYSARLANRSEECFARRAEEILFMNRYFSYFETEVYNEKRALDMRIYRQERLIIDHLKNSVWMAPDGPLARVMRGAMGILKAASTAASYLFIGIVYAFVCLKAYGGAFGVGSVTQYISAITAMAAGVSALLQELGRMKANVPFLKTCFEFLDTPNSMYQGTLTVEKRMDRRYEIEFRDVSFQYPDSDTWALRHVSTRFRVGERMAIVGENGSGKTTFIKLLCRLYDPTEGEILLNGINIRKYNYLEYLSVFSVVFQDFCLMAFSLGENVAAAQNYDKKRALECLRQAGFSERLERMPMGIDTPIYKEFDENGVEISGGEAQKIAIARALYKDAPFIILDEPTAALDPIAEAEIYLSFDKLVGDKTAIYISHRLSSCRFCDEILVFDKGEIVQKGTHQALVAVEDGQYYRLWSAQAQYYQ